MFIAETLSARPDLSIAEPVQKDQAAGREMPGYGKTANPLRVVGEFQRD